MLPHLIKSCIIRVNFNTSLWVDESCPSDQTQAPQNLASNGPKREDRSCQVFKEMVKKLQWWKLLRQAFFCWVGLEGIGPMKGWGGGLHFTHFGQICTPRFLMSWWRKAPILTQLDGTSKWFFFFFCFNKYLLISKSYVSIAK